MLVQKRLLLCVSDYGQALRKALTKLRAKANEASHVSAYRLVQIASVNPSHNHNSVPNGLSQTQDPIALMFTWQGTVTNVPVLESPTMKGLMTDI